MNNSLYDKLGSIGFRVVSKEIKEDVEIEEVLIQALYEVDNDSRMLGLIFSWAKIHHKHIFADRFFRSYEGARKYLGECPWVNALCAYLVDLKDHRFKKGVVKLPQKRFVGNRDQASAIKMRGAISYLKSINILIPNGNIRIRESDVVSPRDLVKLNVQYRNRLLFGTNWRAEIITAIMSGVENANQISKLLGIQRSRVGVVFKEYQIVTALKI